MLVVCPDPNIQSSAAYVFHAMALHSLDKAKQFSSEILPLVFLAMHAKPQEEEDGEMEGENDMEGRMVRGEREGLLGHVGW